MQNGWKGVKEAELRTGVNFQFCRSQGWKQVFWFWVGACREKRTAQLRGRQLRQTGALVPGSRSTPQHEP